MEVLDVRCSSSGCWFHFHKIPSTKGTWVFISEKGSKTVDGVQWREVVASDLNKPVIRPHFSHVKAGQLISRNSGFWSKRWCSGSLQKGVKVKPFLCIHMTQLAHLWIRNWWWFGSYSSEQEEVACIVGQRSPAKTRGCMYLLSHSCFSLESPI